jgi:DNA-binding LytR/AlgR family response regulator
MICIAIVEDEAAHTRKLTEYLSRYEAESGEVFEITPFTDGDGITEAYQNRFDIILMDIEMPFLDGMSAAREIRKRDSEVVIIFITNMSQYAIQGYEVDALDYILKPVSYFAFSRRLDKAVSRIKNRTTRYIAVTVKGGTWKLDVSRIFYAESRGHTIIYHTASGEYVSRGTMKELEDTLEGMHFFRGNNCYLINLEYVAGVVGGCAMVNGERLILSRPRKKAFLEAVARYLGEVVK